MNDVTKRRLWNILALIVGVLFGGLILSIYGIIMLFGYYPCPSCWRLMKDGTRYCPHCYSKIAWRGDVDF